MISANKGKVRDIIIKSRSQKGTEPNKPKAIMARYQAGINSVAVVTPTDTTINVTLSG